MYNIIILLFSYNIVPDRDSLFIADTLNSRIRLVILSTLIMSTYAGDGTPNYGGDGGSATNAQINTPYSVAEHPESGRHSYSGIFYYYSILRCILSR